MTLQFLVTSIDPEVEELDDEELEVTVTDEDDEEVVVLVLDVAVAVMETDAPPAAHIELPFFGA